LCIQLNAGSKSGTAVDNVYDDSDGEKWWQGNFLISWIPGICQRRHYIEDLLKKTNIYDINKPHF
jgi:hypothetical protein